MMIGFPEASVTGDNSSGVPHLPHLATLPTALAGSTRFFVPQFLQATTTGMIAPLEFHGLLVAQVFSPSTYFVALALRHFASSLAPK